jgi:hypothetical protein
MICLAQGGTVEPTPHPTFLGGKAWTCPTCERTFSEAHPTIQSRLSTAGVRRAGRHPAVGAASGDLTRP